MIGFEAERLRKLGIDPARMQGYQVLCLPENFDSATSVGELLDASSSADLSKRLKVAGLKCGNSFDLGLEIGVREKRAGDVWLGVVRILEGVVVPVVLGVIAGLLTSMIERKRKSGGAAEGKGEAGVHVSVSVVRGESLTRIRYDGDPETLKQLLSGVGERRGEGDEET